MLLYARICSRAPHPAESRGIFGRPPSLAPGPRRRPGPATRGHGPSERDLPKDLGLSEVEAEASACLEDVRSLQAEVEELRQQVNSLSHKISEGAPLGARAAAEEGSYYSNGLHSEASSWYSDEEASQPQQQQQQQQEQQPGAGWWEAREANGTGPSGEEDGHWGAQQALGHEHSGGYVNGFDTRAGSRAPPDDTGEAAAEGDQYWASHAEQSSSGSDSSGGDDGGLESNPFFTDQFLGVLRGSLQRQGEEALTDTTPPAEPRASPNDEMLEHAVVQSKQTLLFMLQWRQQLDQSIAVQQKQVERIDFALSKTRSDAAYTRVLKDMVQES